MEDELDMLDQKHKQEVQETESQEDECSRRDEEAEGPNASEAPEVHPDDAGAKT